MQNAVKKTSVCKLNLAHGNKANYPLGKSPWGVKYCYLSSTDFSYFTIN